MTTPDEPDLLETLFAELLRDVHQYAPGIQQHVPTIVDQPSQRRDGALVTARERVRDAVERVAARAGFSRRHFDPEFAASRLARVAALSDGLAETYAEMGDARSRQAMLDVLKLRVLGPYHAPLPLTPARYKDKQALAHRTLRRESATIEVSDPYFSPLSLYEAPIAGGRQVRLHSHSVDVVSVFLLDQYGYGDTVAAEPGDVVFDVGGCWGDTALYFAELVGAEGRVFTFEFDPENLAIMRRNLELNPDLADRIEIVESALWHTSGEKLGFVQGGRMSALSANGRADAPDGSVVTLTLDDFVDQRGIERVDLVKMDVEGAELDVLAGARGTLSRSVPKLALAAYHKDDDLVTIPAALRSLDAGYRFYLETSSPLEDETVLFARGRRPE